MLHKSVTPTRNVLKFYENSLSIIVACNFTKRITPPRVFLILQNGTKSCKASQVWKTVTKHPSRHLPFQS